MSNVAEALRTSLGNAVRSRVAGPDAATRAAELFRPDGPHWFERGRPIRQVHADASMFMGGLRALLLQTMHPLAMAGVADHSGFRSDPWGRLQRTADFLAATTYGSTDVAEAAVARVHAVHHYVRGTAPDGRPYSAADPHLMRWVHVVEVDSFLAAYQRYGAERLSADERDGYVADMAVVARAMGVPAPPMSERALRDQLRSFRSELQATPAAREAVRYMLLSPPLPAPARPLYAVLAAASVALMPRWSRWPLRLPNLPVAEALAVAPAAEVVTRLLRWSLTETRQPEVVGALS
jgi:uncharacterized protein (DUF2236 family)